MKVLIKAIGESFAHHRKAGILVPFAIWMAALFVVNYSLDFEDNYIDTIADPVARWAAMWAFQTVPYIVTCLLLRMHFGKEIALKNFRFWAIVIFGFAVLSFDRTVYFWGLFEDLAVTAQARSKVYYMYKIASMFKGVFTVILPLIFLSLIADRYRKTGAYGLRPAPFDLKPYIILLAGAAVMVAIGSTISDMQNFYPKYARSGGSAFAQAVEIPEWLAVVAYEAAYGFDFISTEYFFRGFLVIGLYRFLGPYVLLPMAASYAVLHFGKPAAEALSSVFGGYILGVIAIHHRSIWGGVIVHVGLAWMMEIAGYLMRL